MITLVFLFPTASAEEPRRLRAGEADGISSDDIEDSAEAWTNLI